MFVRKKLSVNEEEKDEGRHYILPTKTTSIERDWDWILNNLKVVTEDSRKMYGWYARTTEHPNTRSDVLTTEPPGL